MGGEIKGLAFDEGGQAAFASCAEESIAFPVADACLLVNDRRAMLDRDASLEPGIGMRSCSATAVLLPAASQVAIKVSSQRFIAADILVYGLVRYPMGRLRWMVHIAQASGDLLGRPPQFESGDDMLHEHEVPRLMGVDDLFAPFPVLEVGPVRAVPSADRIMIAPEFP
jgi:hypothetical protein